MASQPERIDRYEIKSPIGGGGMGTLYLAQDPNTGRLVALKLLRASVDSGELRARFQREAQALAALNHQNIVTIYDSGAYRGTPFMVMEYVRGETLAEKLARRAQAPLAQTLKWLAELCAGVAHAHQSGVIHRDIKPSNLMVDRQDRLKIVDFGIARVTESLGRASAQVTQMHVQIGTPGYMAPEQMRGTAVDYRCDIFAVGAVAYELLSGREAFEGRNAVEVQQKVMRSQTVPLLSMVPDLPPGVAGTVHRALQHDPAARFGDAAEMGAAFERERARLVPVATSPAAPPAADNPARGSRADEAFHQSLAALDDGAPGPARRHALEALAESPDHPGARTILTEIDGRRAAAPSPRGSASAPPLRPALPAPPPAAPGRREFPPTTAEEKTIVMRRPEALTPRPMPPRAVTDEPKTIAVPAQVPRRPPPPHGPAPARAAPPPPYSATPRSDDATIIIRRPAPQAPAGAAGPAKPRGRRRDWLKDLGALVPDTLTPWQRATLALAAALVVATAVGVVLWEPWATRYELTLLPAEGGTLRGPGLECGTQGDDCSGTFRAGQDLAIEARADRGYVLAEYRADCAPSGRLVVRGPLRCGATFRRVDASSGVATAGSDEVILTVVRPDGATVVGQSINCGRQDQCEARFAVGTVVELRADATGGGEIAGFTGDCDKAGRVVMDGPKICAVQLVGQSPGGLDRPGPTTKPGGPSGVADGPPPNADRKNVRGPTPPVPPVEPPVPPGVPVSVNPSQPPQNPPPGTPPAPGTPEKPPAPIVTRQAAARDRIAETLKRYLAAYNALDYDDLKRVFVNAPGSIRAQLRDYVSMEHTFGEPTYLSMDADGNVARIEVPYKQVVKPRIGGTQELEGKAVFDVHRQPDDETFVITNAAITPKARK